MALIQCPNCNSTVDTSSAAFCPNCGAPATQPAQPVYQEPAQPVYQEPVQPVYQQPVYQQPVYQQPVYQQPVYQQPVYQQPVYQAAPAAPEQRGNAFAIVGFILNIISACVCWIPAIGAIISWLCIPGLAFCVVGMIRKNAAKKGLAIAGLVLGVIALVFWIIQVGVFSAAGY